MVNRYIGNTGRVQRIPESRPEPEVPHEQRHMEPKPMQKPPPKNIGGGINHSMQGLMRRINNVRLDQEDLILLLILYLLYRESGDTEFLITLAAFVFL